MARPIPWPPYSRTMPRPSGAASAVLDIGVLVFREGLECILVLAAITASMTGAKQALRRPVALGAGIAFLATLITWCIAIGIMGQLTESVPALDMQAATGLTFDLIVCDEAHRTAGIASVRGDGGGHGIGSLVLV